jgi:predicted nucleic acid-binding protein
LTGNLVVDASALLAVLMSEAERTRIVALTQDVDLIAPASVHREMGNALSNMLTRGRITLTQAAQVVRNLKRFPSGLLK